MRIKEILKAKNQLDFLHLPEYSNEDVIGYMKLFSVFSSINTYLPISSSTLSPGALAVICNDLIINNRKRVLELGSGVSTVFLAKFIQRYNLKTLIISIEENKLWQEKIQQILFDENLSDFVKLIFSPYVEKLDWYDDSFISGLLRDYTPVDTIIIDGPQSWQKGRELSRKSALYKLHGLLAEDFSIFLDDIARKGEKSIVKLWEKEFSLKFKVYNRQIAISMNGKHYNIF